MTAERPVFPFAAIVGQEPMKEALLLNLVLPSIGGLLIRGEKGTAKSTAVRSLAGLLPSREVIADCPFHCSPGGGILCSQCEERLAAGGELRTETVKMKVVELPLSATEDRVVGTLDLEHALRTGGKRFEPGVLAAANGNILYVDEVNLLDDHLVDLLLDASAMGMNYVEREGVSFSHPSRFILVGTMNPEEGELRPQLLDRFGLIVDVKGEPDLARRKEVVRRRIAFERSPGDFSLEHAAAQNELVSRVEKARGLVAHIEPSDEVLEMAAKVSMHLGVDGHRADLTLVKASMASAALQGRSDVRIEDLTRVAGTVLPHRMRRQPYERSELDIEELKAWISAQAH